MAGAGGESTETAEGELLGLGCELSGVGRKLERTLERRPVVHRLAVRDDHVLEREVEKGR